MQILITKDGATKVPREVGSREEALAFVSQGFHVEAQQKDGTFAALEPDALEAQVEFEQPVTPAPVPKPKPAAKKTAAAPAPTSKRKR